MKTTIVFFLLVTSSFTYSQIVDPDDPQGAVKQEINSAIKNTFGSDYRAAFDILDSTFTKKQGTSPNSVFRDPQGLLKGYILFVADKWSARDLEHGIMGLYKNGHIAWHTDSIIQGVGGGIYSIKDINNDGTVDILYEWYPNDNILVRYLWIISWNGTSGTLLNDIDSEDGNTTILAVDSHFDLMEDTTSHIFKIRALWPDSDERETGYFPKTQLSSLPFVTYVWNGAKYILGAENDQIPRTALFPANQFILAVKSNVRKSGDSLAYEYTLKNSSASKQTIIKFLLTPVCSNISLKCPNDWFVGTNTDFKLGLWSVKDGLTNKGGVVPGKSRKNFTVVSTTPPAIAKYYAQGNRPYTQFTQDEVSSPSFKQTYIGDLLHNSVNGFTVAPSQDIGNIPSPAYCDTLMSYTNQSLALGWLAQKKDLDISDGESIKDSIATNLIKRLQSIKSTLVAGDSVVARGLMDKFLTKVEAEHARSANRMSDECYALLKYNGEYLRDKLPAK